MSKYKFLNHQMLAKIDRKVAKIRKAYPNGCQDWQLYDMVATIISGQADKTFFHDDGIIVDGWNGYKGYTDNANPDPQSAYGGFYRTEKAQMLGTAIRYTKQALESDGDLAATAQLEQAGANWGHYNWIWEPVARIWGYYSWAEFYTEAEAESVARQVSQQASYKRHKVTYSDMSGMWRVAWETGRSKPIRVSDYQTTIPQRVNKDGKEMTR